MFIEEIIGAFTGQNKRDRRRQVCTATIFGLLAGATAGLLLAPKSGEETRAEIAKGAVKGANVVKDYSVEASKKIKETATDVYSKVEDGIKQFLSKEEEVQDVVEDAAKQARAAARDARRKARAQAEKAEDVLTETIAETVEDAEA